MAQQSYKVVFPVNGEDTVVIVRVTATFAPISKDVLALLGTGPEEQHNLLSQYLTELGILIGADEP